MRRRDPTLRRRAPTPQRRGARSDRQAPPPRPRDVGAAGVPQRSRVAPPPLRLAPELFISCLPGLEPLLQQELAELVPAMAAAVGAGGCTLPTGDPDVVARLNLHAGLAVRVLLRLGRFHCRSLGELARKSARVPWAEWLLPGRFTVRADSRHSRLYHRDAIAERVAGAIADALGAPAAGEAQPVVHARFLDDGCTLSLDTSGRPLHDRGYRVEPGPAPLREDLARALVLASGWDRKRPLIDPFAGAGTIPIEAALLARGQAPGRHREFAFAGTRLFDAGRWARLLAAADAAVLPGARILASDRRPDCIGMTARNAERAGVHADLELAAAPLGQTPWRDALAGAGAVVTDPPHGRRLGEAKALVQLYRALGTWLAAAPADCAVALLAGNRRLALRTGLALQTAFLTSHGGVKVRALVRAPALSAAVAPA